MTILWLILSRKRRLSQRLKNLAICRHLHVHEVEGPISIVRIVHV
jgi:hypothetical protein